MNGRILDSYPFQSVEKKWRHRWEENKTHEVDLTSDRKKFYVLVMFSYPSEKKLHIGHWWNYGGVDTFARFKRMQGYNVFEPMGFDAFGLPAENFAIKHNVHPAITTKNSVDFIREQLKQIGAMYDWGKEVDTSSPEYYKWTQWLFLQLFKTGNAYRKQAPVNWCSKCQTVLANEQVLDNGECERCGTTIITKDLEQWFFRTTAFADDLLEGLDRIDWLQATKTRQRQWIGRSEGTEIKFRVKGGKILTFTTRADTLFGVTYVVLAPEHELVSKLTVPDQRVKVESYVNSARTASDIERLSTAREKTGVFTGSWAINPVNGEEIPIWIADYVLASYGTGAVMAVPAHDQRDYEFSSRYNLPVKWVIKPSGAKDVVSLDHADEEYGVMCNSAQFNGLTSSNGRDAVTAWLEKNGSGQGAVTYRLRDWLISRQRYWGAPIPIVYCDSCGIVPIPEEDLPVLLPEEGVDFTPRGTSPLGSCKEFIETTCPKCGKSARRDADTMDTFVCSSWYFLRYTSTHVHNRPFDKELLNKWLPIDVYIGGPEHATGHLIYFRYITKFLNSQGYLDFDEPANRMVHQGIITHHGLRMSKSKGNVVNPDEYISKHGSDCFRLYLMFMGDFKVGGDWNDEGIKGISRFQNRVWRLVKEWAPRICDDKSSETEVNPTINRVMHHTIKEVTKDIENFEFNTAISRLMEFVNSLYQFTADRSAVNTAFLGKALDTLIKLIGPFAPHLSEELWELLGNKESVFDQILPTHDESALGVETVTIAVQINGKLIDTIEMPENSPEEEVVREAFKSIRVTKRIDGKEIRRTIHVRDRILNLVV